LTDFGEKFIPINFLFSHSQRPRWECSFFKYSILFSINYEFLTGFDFIRLGGLQNKNIRNTGGARTNRRFVYSKQKIEELNFLFWVSPDYVGTRAPPAIAACNISIFIFRSEIFFPIPTNREKFLNSAWHNNEILLGFPLPYKKSLSRQRREGLRGRYLFK